MGKLINNDKIPELIFYTEMYFGYGCTYVVYTYFNGKMKRLQILSYAGEINMYNKSKIFMVVSEKWGSYFMTYNSYYKIKNGKMKLVALKMIDHGDDGMDNIDAYQLNGKTVSKKKFNNYMRNKKCSSKSVKVNVDYGITDDNILYAIKNA